MSYESTELSYMFSITNKEFRMENKGLQVRLTSGLIRNLPVEVVVGKITAPTPKLYSGYNDIIHFI